MTVMENAHALVIGIADYQYINSLPQTVTKDAQDMYNLLIDPQHCGYPSKNVKLMLNGQATQAAIRQALTDLAKHSNHDSTIFFYISSHGGRIEAGPYAGEYLLLVDVVYDSDKTVAQTAISNAEFTEVLQTGRGRVILASSRSTEFSYVLPGASNSLFTQYLLAGLHGDAPGPGGVIRIFDLFHYVQPKVTAEQANQHPIFKAEVEENFPVALYLGGKAPAPTPVIASIDNFVYDVFISYRQQEPDKTWVRKTLLPKLEGNGLHVCIDYRDFRRGAPLIKEMERAIEQSRYTLAILSPAYLNSTFTELENILAEYLGLERSQRRLLAVMHEACTPRLGIRTRLWLDMTDDGEFEINIARLVYELQQSSDV